jgi:hypothetical protein
MRTSTLVAIAILFLPCRPAVGQAYPGFTTSQGIHALALDSVGGTIRVYRSPGVTRADAIELQALMTECETKYRDSIPTLPSVELAILDSAVWIHVTTLPYGLPHHNPTASPVVVVVPATASKMFPTVIGTDQPDRFFHLLALHELGHVLMFAAIHVDRGAPWDVRHLPDWYLEFTASYIALSCLSGRPADARLLRGSEDSLRALPLPSFTRLDEFSKILTMQTGDGVPYVSTPTGAAHFAWYQRLMGETAGRTQQRLGLGLVPLLRTQWARTGAVTTADIVRDLGQSDPGLAAWLQGFRAVP